MVSVVAAPPAGVVAVVTAEELAQLIKSLKGGPKQLDALRSIRTILSTDDAHTDALLQLGVVARLTAILAHGSDADAAVEVLWCLTNLAGGTHEHAIPVLTAVPFLVNLLSSPNKLLQVSVCKIWYCVSLMVCLLNCVYVCVLSRAACVVQEHSAWVLGNLAADSPECRSLLVKNGVLSPLLLLLSVVSPGATQRRVVLTAAWAVTNLLMAPDAHPVYSQQAIKLGLLQRLWPLILVCGNGSILRLSTVLLLPKCALAALVHDTEALDVMTRDRLLSCVWPIPLT